LHLDESEQKSPKIMQKLNFDLSIYTFDIDAAGHVGNNVYLQWVEMGRCKFLEAVNFPIHTAMESGVVPVIANMNIAYKKPLYLGEKVLLEIWLSELKKVAHTLEFRFYNGAGALAATGQQRGVFVNSTTLKPTALAPKIRDLFMPYVHDTL
jgi:acyl-CoA thioester hydrolase